MVARLIAAAALFLMLLVPIRAETIEGVSLTVEVENGEHGFHPQQLVLLRARALFRVTVTLEKLQVPDIPGARNLVIGRDKWTDVMRDGLPWRQMERVVGVIPQRSGPLAIPPFTHQLTLVDRSLKQIKVAVTSDPLVIDVKPAPVPNDTWWIAANDLTVEESWSVPPDALAIGQSTRRTITFEAVGVMDDQLPPPPPLRADGLIAFPGPASRETMLGLGPNQIRQWELPLREQSLRKPTRYREVPSDVDGPVSRVSYTWDIRPTTDRAVLISAIEIPWYDTARGEMRTFEIPARTVSLAANRVTAEILTLEKTLGIEATDPMPPESDGWRSRLLSVAAAAAGAMAAGAAAATILLPGTLTARFARFTRWRMQRKLIRDFREAARRSDARAARGALVALAVHGVHPRNRDPNDLGLLDRLLFREEVDARPDLQRLACLAFTSR